MLSLFKSCVIVPFKDIIYVKVIIIVEKEGLVVGGIFEASSGQQLMIFKNFVFEKEKTEGYQIIWLCSSHGAHHTRCPAFFFMEGANMTKMNLRHNHAPNANTIMMNKELKKAYNKSVKPFRAKT